MPTLTDYLKAALEPEDKEAEAETEEARLEREDELIELMMRDDAEIL